jgi:hypothetical protein
LQGRRAAGVIGVTVCDQDASQRPAAERSGDRVDVRGLPHAGIDQRGLGPVKQPGVIAAPGHGTGIGCRDQNRERHGGQSSTKKPGLLFVKESEK